jgi:hypothetical protein
MQFAKNKNGSVRTAANDVVAASPVEYGLMYYLKGAAQFEIQFTSS